MNVCPQASLKRKLFDQVLPNTKQTYQVGHTCTENPACNWLGGLVRPHAKHFQGERDRRFRAEVDINAFSFISISLTIIEVVPLPLFLLNEVPEKVCANSWYR